MAIETRHLAAPSLESASSGTPAAAKAQSIFTPRFGGRDRMFFTERLALLLETGTPLHGSLEILAAQAGGPPQQEVIEGLAQDVSTGVSFADALRRQPEAFPETYTSLVSAAERGAFLPEVLKRLLEMDENRHELRSTVVGALSYPAFLVVFSAAVVVFVLVVVFPKFWDLFSSIADELPITTLFLMGASEILRQHWLPLLAGGAAAAVVIGRWARGPAGAAVVDRLSYRLPLVRGFAIEYHTIQFLRVMGLSLQNGVPMMEALGSCRSVVKNERFRAFVDRLENHVAEGRGLAVGFQEADFLPPLASQMVATGEETGSLARVMTRVAEFYEREWRKRLSAVTKMIEPAMLLIMGVVVGVIVSSLLLPIFKLSRAVG